MVLRSKGQNSSTESEERKTVLTHTGLLMEGVGYRFSAYATNASFRVARLPEHFEQPAFMKCSRCSSTLRSLMPVRKACFSACFSASFAAMVDVRFFIDFRGLVPNSSPLHFVDLPLTAT
jgi:hypothetical protein